MLSVTEPHATSGRTRELHGTSRAPLLNGLADLAADLFHAPVAVISCLEAGEQVARSRHGSDDPETPAELSFCSYVARLNQKSPVVLEDASNHPEFSQGLQTDGARAFEFLCGSVLRAPDGTPLGVLAIMDHQPRPTLSEQDVGRLQSLVDLAEKALKMDVDAVRSRINRNVLDLARKLSGIGHWRAFPKTQQVEWSPELYAIYGFSPATFPPCYGVTRKIFSEEDAQRLEQLYLEAARTGTGFDYEVAITTGDGRTRLIAGKTDVHIDEAGEVDLIVGVIQDVTDFMTAAAAAETAANTRVRFLANMSHELRSPLTGIIGFADLAAGQPGVSGKTREYLQLVRNAGQALLTAVTDVLDFSKLELGQMKIRPEPVDVVQLCEQTLAIVSRQEKAQSLRLHLQCDRNCRGLSLLDAGRVRQILLNLLDNAVKFTVQGQVRLSVSRSDGRLCFEVQDTGPGLTEESQTYLFSSPGAVKGSMSGLGLSICKGLAEAMGGQIGVDSTLGKGSRFWFRIPAPAVSSRGEIRVAEGVGQENVLNGARILVAEDHAGNRELTRVILAALGAQVTWTDNGKDAVGQAKTQEFDLIILDLEMPLLRGIEACRQIKSASPVNSRTPVIAFAADLDLEVPGLGAPLGFDGVILKPFGPANLVSTILKVLTERQAPAGITRSRSLYLA